MIKYIPGQKKTEREEKDGCALVAFIDKEGQRRHANIVNVIDALKKMGHRSGDINGEGDGCGIMADIPRLLWAKDLTVLGMTPQPAESENFFVGHLLLPLACCSNHQKIKTRILELFRDHETDILIERAGRTCDAELGPRARADAPVFWQIAGMTNTGDRRDSRKNLFRLQLEIEKAYPEIHIASLSIDSVVYKVQGLPDLLPRVYPELRDEDMRSAMTLGHGRYSTNTLPTVTRSQPFSLLCHNGEINTIDRLRSISRTLGIEPVPSGSDSQDLNRVVEGLVNFFDLDILEAIELVFPAIYSEAEKYPPEIREMYSLCRWMFPCSAQGPAAILARFDNVCLGSVDAMGLRPLWFGENDFNYFLSSEKGVVELVQMLHDPRPLAPGEKIAIIGGAGRQSEILDYGGIQKRLAVSFKDRYRVKKLLSSMFSNISRGGRRKKGRKPLHSAGPNLPGASLPRLLTPRNLKAFGWRRYDMQIRQEVAKTGREVIGSLGYTGPLAALVPDTLPNLSDYCKENVAVVTNPALDRERETEHFSTRVILGHRPEIRGGKTGAPIGVVLNSPLLLGAQALSEFLEEDRCRQLCERLGTCLLEDIVDFFPRQRDAAAVHFQDVTFIPGQGLMVRLKAIADEVKQAIAEGAVLVILEDTGTFAEQRVFIDPALIVAYLNESLIAGGLRGKASLIVQSGAVRNLHDLMFLLGLGADGVYPYMLWAVSAQQAEPGQGAEAAIVNTHAVLQKGMEKVMSTMGIHEICGYGRVFSAIGFQLDVAELMKIPTFCSSTSGGLSLAGLESFARMRHIQAMAADEVRFYNEPEKNPKIGRTVRNTAIGKRGYLEMADEFANIEEELPTAIRHLLTTRPTEKTGKVLMSEVDIGIGGHAMPLIIAAMSFGSQGENSFRIYAEAAQRANIVCINGEGGEIPDMLGRYKKNRGQQIASGRFGVFVGFLNSADYLEIKIGQGAKPGEGGHLPGSKVSKMVARARHCKEGITLISPSNHHDIYSIEDLAQIITELKTASPDAKISVKIPVTSGIGTIAVGIAKSGADILNISGYEGGTGAAREHSKRYVGLPAEIGVSEAHKALVESGLRDVLEIWADGGMRSGDDVLKMILLGANRVGFGTAVLMAIGCISCRKCHLDQCPRGISTQIQVEAEAKARGLKIFKPRIVEEETENLARFLNAIGDELRMRTAALGEKRLQDLVGRADLLEQYRLHEDLDVSELLKKPAPPGNPEQFPRPQITRKPLNYLTRLISDLSMTRFDHGETIVHFAEDGVHSTDRAVGTYLAGALERKYGSRDRVRKVFLRLSASVPGNGLCAFLSSAMQVFVEGGSQDGAGKGSMGGVLGVFKGQNSLGRYIDGSTGKSFAYGATGGLFMVQNMADSRACVRMSGADVVFGGRIRAPILDELGNIASRAHLKGFAFEYMTGGRAVVLGDPGPWICAGMTGGVIYQCLYSEFGFDREALTRRLAGSASVTIHRLNKTGKADLYELLERYILELRNGFQEGEADAVSEILQEADKRFLMVQPKAIHPHSAE